MATAVKPRIARVHTIALVPGVSKNGRLYTKENIANATKRMKQRIAEGKHPVTVRSHHGAGDNSTLITGSVKEVSQDEQGNMHIWHDIADNTAGRDMLGTIVPDENGKPSHLATMSIRGQWVGDPHTVTTDDGMEAMTADDLDIDGVDYTASPGVPGAQIQDVEMAESKASESIFYESVDSELTFEEVAPPEPTIQEKVLQAQALLNEISESDLEELTPGASNYADPGWQKDKKKRYPLDTAARVRAAWAYINMPTNAAKYSDAHLKTIKGKIKTAAKKFNIAISGESVQQAIDLLEALLEASSNVSLYTDDVSVNVSTYTSQPEELPDAATKAMQGALSALKTVDPDNDGDIDLSPNSTEVKVPESTEPETPVDSEPTTEPDESPANTDAKEPETPAAPDAPETPEVPEEPKEAPAETPAPAETADLRALVLETLTDLLIGKSKTDESDQASQTDSADDKADADKAKGDDAASASEEPETPEETFVPLAPPRPLHEMTDDQQRTWFNAALKHEREWEKAHAPAGEAVAETSQTQPVETTQPTTTSEESKVPDLAALLEEVVDRRLQEQKALLVQSIVKDYGVPTRKGHVVHMASEATEEDLSKMSNEELRAKFGSTLTEHFIPSALLGE